MATRSGSRFCGRTRRRYGLAAEAGQSSQSSAEHRATADHTLAHFEVADIETVVGELEKREVKFIDYADGPLQTTGHIAQIGPARGAWLRDPDGNVLGLRQAP